jgi:hypothetical protein
LGGLAFEPVRLDRVELELAASLAARGVPMNARDSQRVQRQMAVLLSLIAGDAVALGISLDIEHLACAATSAILLGLLIEIGAWSIRALTAPLERPKPIEPVGPLGTALFNLVMCAVQLVMLAWAFVSANLLVVTLSGILLGCLMGRLTQLVHALLRRARERAP